MTKGKENLKADSQSMRLDVLLLISTVLLGVTFNVMKDSTWISKDLKGLILEVSLVLLFSSYLYLLLSWKPFVGSYQRREFEQVSTVHLLTLNGILISVLVSYAVSLLGLNLTSLKIPEDIESTVYVFSLLLVFVIMPIWIYLGSSRRIVEVSLGLVLFDRNKEESVMPLILGFVLFLVLLSLLLVYSSKALNVLTMVSFLVFLPYLGVSQREKIERIRSTYSDSNISRVSKGVVDAISIHSTYFGVVVCLFFVYDLFFGNVSLTIEWVLLGVSYLGLWVLAVGLTRWELSKIGRSGLFLLVVGGVSVILFFKGNNSQLPVTVGVFSIYLLIALMLVLPEVIVLLKPLFYKVLRFDNG